LLCSNQYDGWNFAGGSPTNIEAIVGEEVAMECPANTTNDQIIWWRERNRLVIRGEVRVGYEDRLSFNRSTGALYINAATLTDAGVYACGSAFDKKHFVKLTVVGELSLVLCLVLSNLN